MIVTGQGLGPVRFRAPVCPNVEKKSLEMIVQTLVCPRYTSVYCRCGAALSAKQSHKGNDMQTIVSQEPLVLKQEGKPDVSVEYSYKEYDSIEEIVEACGGEEGCKAFCNAAFKTRSVASGKQTAKIMLAAGKKSLSDIVAKVQEVILNYAPRGDTMSKAKKADAYDSATASIAALPEGATLTKEQLLELLSKM